MSPSTATKALAACGCALALAAGVAPSSLAARPAEVRLGGSPHLPSAATALGELPGRTRIQIAVALRPSDPAGLERFATAVSTPGSPAYRHYITPAQFAARFGAGDAEVEAVDASLAAHGLTPGPVSANRLAIPVVATAAQLERAFATRLERVALPSGVRAIVNTAAPLLDASIAGLVQSIEGLSTLSAPRPHLAHQSVRVTRVAPHAATGGPQPCAAARAAAPGQGAYTTDQIASAYGFSGLYQAGDEGAGQTIAVYELEPYAPGDVAAYQACYGTQTSISNVTVDGGAGSGAGQGEAALDIEQVIGLAPKANVLVYEGPNSNSGAPGAGPYDTYRAIVEQDRARVVTTSWGQCEPLEGPTNAAAENTLFQEAAAQGQTIVSAAGDQGSEDCNNPPLNPNGSLAVDDPSSQPFVTGVGGTTLSSLGPRPTERVWNNGGSLIALLGLQPGSGGGGESSLWRMPPYQAGAASFLNVRQSGARDSPDVSANADPNTGYLIYYQGSWSGIGGTSGAAPLWAALLALANASSGCRGAVVGFANPALYQAAGAAYVQDFNDVRVGNNDFTGTGGGRYAAGTGYDMASGLGTPNATALASSLCAHATRIGSPRVSSVTLSGIRKRHPKLQFTVSSGENAPALEMAAISLPRGLRFAGGWRRVAVIGPDGHPAGFSSTLRHGVLAIRLRTPKTRIRVTIAYMTLTATRSEAAAVRSGHAGKLRITLTVTDARSHRSRLTTTIKPKS